MDLNLNIGVRYILNRYIYKIEYIKNKIYMK